MTLASLRVTRAWVPWVLMGLGALAIAVLAGAPPEGGPPLDPDSTDADGTKALVVVLRELGAVVDLSSRAPDEDDEVMLVLEDTLDEAQTEQVRDWVRGGGTLVVADLQSNLGIAPPSGDTALELVEPELRRGCDVAALRDVDRLLVPNGVLLRVPEEATGCFGQGPDDAFLVTAPVDEGRVVQLGGAGVFINSRLNKLDDGLLAARLLVPHAGTRVLFLRPGRVGGGDKTLVDLVSPRVKWALLQLAIAFVVVVVWRARRLGKPVLESQPVQLAGSELVGAVGHLMQRARGRSQAASLLRDDLRRTLCERLGLPVDTPAEQVADTAAARTGLPAARLRAALEGPVPSDEDGLVTLAQTIESVRQEVTSAH